jgi:Tfp pilus assembly protein PilW
MAISTNDAIVKLGTTKTLEANGAAITNNAMGAADDATYSISADGASAPDAEFALAATFATAPTINTTLDLYAQELDIDGTNDAQAPTTTYKVRYLGSFAVNAVTTAQYLKCRAYDVPLVASYFLMNNATGQTLSAGWTLKVTPRTIGPAA